MSEYTKPLPDVNKFKEFWEGCKQHKLMVQKCNACGTYRWYPRPVCGNCGSMDTGWAELNGKGKMAILEGVPGQFANEMRLKGFRRVVNEKDTPDIQIVASQPANWQRELAMSTMENILQGNPDIDLVWGVNDGMALGALKAITDAGLQDKIKVLGYNGDEEAVESVSKGQMYSTILQQPAEIGRMVITIAEMIRTGKKSEVESVITIPIVNVKKENAAQYLKK